MTNQSRHSKHISKQVHIVPHIASQHIHTHTPIRTWEAICPRGARGADDGGGASCGEGRAASGEDSLGHRDTPGRRAHGRHEIGSSCAQVVSTDTLRDSEKVESDCSDQRSRNLSILRKRNAILIRHSERPARRWSFVRSQSRPARQPALRKWRPGPSRWARLCSGPDARYMRRGSGGV